MDVTVIIATYGDTAWLDLAAKRALPSALNAIGPDARVRQVHGASLHEARNLGAAESTTEWLCFLDADDEISAGYFTAMARARADLRAPFVSYVRDGVADEPVSLAGRDIEFVNPCVIGTVIRRELFHALGGFRPWPAWEDWALFLAAVRAGATVEHVPGAIYRAHVRAKSRNRTVETPRALHARIRRDPVMASAL